MPHAQTSIVVGIAGGTASGKTTFAERLAGLLPRRSVQLLDHDAYYRDRSDLPPAERAKVNFDHPDALESDLLAAHIRDLRQGRAIEKPCYDFATHARRPQTERVEPAEVLLVEGILVLAAEEIRRELDLRLFVDTPADLRILRRVRRDVAERGRTIDGVMAQYMTTTRPMHERYVEPSRAFADLVIPALEDNDRALRMAADALRHRLRLVD